MNNWTMAIGLGLFFACAFASPLVAQTGKASLSILDAPEAYFGQPLPGDQAKEFVIPGFGKAMERIAISGDGREIYFSDTAAATVCSVSYDGKKWGSPQVLFKGFIMPALSPDGSQLFMEDSAAQAWFSQRKNGAWSAPAKLFDGDSKRHYLQKTRSGNFFATAEPVVGSLGDISRLVVAGTGAKAESLGAPVNGKNGGFDFFMAPDESYVVTVIRTGGSGNLALCLKKPDGTWTPPAVLGPGINSRDWEYGQYVSPDGKYLFFTRDGAGSTFWVRFDTIVSEMKKQAGLN